MYETSPGTTSKYDYPHVLLVEEGGSYSWSSLVGIVTAIIGNVLISIALNTQRYAHIRIEQEYNQGKGGRKTQKRLPKSIRGYGSIVQQEQAAEERARINAEAPGLSNTTDEDTYAFGHNGKQEPNDQHRSDSFDSQETAKQQDNDEEGQGARKSYLKSPYWWAGLILMIVGETGNFLAYGFAPASIVSPLGVVALISNCLIAPWMLKEHFRKRDFWGVLISIAGAVVVVLSAKSQQTKLGPDELFDAILRWEFLTYIGITCALIVVLMYLSPKYGKRTILIDLGLMGLFGGYTALSTKGVASMLSGSLWQAFTFPITYVLVVVLITSAIMQIRYINRALSNYNSTQVIPTQFVLFTLSVIIGSAILYRDFEKTNLDHAIKFVIGCALTFSGVWLITSGRKDDDGHDEDPEHEETIQLIDEEAEMEEDRTSLKDERAFNRETQDTHQAIDRETSQNTKSNKENGSTSVPSFTLTPSEGKLNNNPWNSSTEDLDPLATPKTPKTPPGHHDCADGEGQLSVTFTPASSSNTRSRANFFRRTDSSPADPQTPARNNRAPSPSKPDENLLTPAEVIETPQATWIRSARGSISRFMPGPLFGPLSSSTLSTVVAESLLKGEGSPRGPIRSRSYQKRRRPSGSLRTERSRRLSANATFDANAPDLESGLTTPTLSRWQTRESVQASRSRSNTGDYFNAGESSERPRTNRRQLLPAFSPSFLKLIDKVKGKDKDPNDSGGESSSRSEAQN